MPPGEAGEEGWTEQFLLPRGMKVDPTKPIVLPAAVVLPDARIAHLVMDADKNIVGVGVAMDDGRFEIFRIGAGFVDTSGNPIT